MMVNEGLFARIHGTFNHRITQSYSPPQIPSCWSKSYMTSPPEPSGLLGSAAARARTWGRWGRWGR
jgi:hypothetical protein